MRGRGRTAVTYSFALICHQDGDYWSFRPFRSKSRRISHIWSERIVHNAVTSADAELRNAIKDMEYKHNFIVESCPPRFRHWLLSNVKAEELRGDSVSDMNHVLKLEINVLLAHIFPVSGVISSHTHII